MAEVDERVSLHDPRCIDRRHGPERACVGYLRPLTHPTRLHHPQSINGCVLCERKWYEHSPEERGDG